MKWMKRAAALTAALLLLSTAVYARTARKASDPDTREALSARLVSPQENQPGKMPVLPVILAEENEDEEERTPLVVPDPSPVIEDLERLVVIPNPSPKADPPEPDEAETPLAPEPEAPPAPEPEDTTGAGMPASNTPSFPEAEDWQILLVNPWHEMPEDYEVHLKALADGNRVDERAFDDLAAMLEACRDAGLRPKICSSYRTMSKQTYLYNNKIARLQKAGYSKKTALAEAGRWVARPGTSEHQLGLAVDIVSSSYQSLTRKQEKTAEQKWLMQHCWEYGFILRYPNDKSEITGIGYEPWHYRYVGREVALDIRDSGLCMEEYIELREETLGKQA